MKFKKRVLKLEISTFKSLPYFLSLYEFLHTKNELKKTENFLLTGFVMCPKQIWENFWLPIVKAWYFPYSLFF